MIVIHVCVMSFFLVKLYLTESQIRRIRCTHTTMYGLRIVMIQGLSKSLSKNAKQKVTSIPMVRATTIDNTERLEGPFDLGLAARPEYRYIQESSSSES